MITTNSTVKIPTEVENLLIQKLADLQSNEQMIKLVELGFITRFIELYAEYRRGECSFGYIAEQLGVSIRDIYKICEDNQLETASV